jgi:hypothetical protein
MGTMKLCFGEFFGAFRHRDKVISSARVIRQFATSASQSLRDADFSGAVYATVHCCGQTRETPDRESYLGFTAAILVRVGGVDGATIALVRRGS